MDLFAICLKVFESIFSPNELPNVQYISKRLDENTYLIVMLLILFLYVLNTLPDGMLVSFFLHIAASLFIFTQSSLNHDVLASVFGVVSFIDNFFSISSYLTENLHQLWWQIHCTIYFVVKYHLTPFATVIFLLFLLFCIIHKTN